MEVGGRTVGRLWALMAGQYAGSGGLRDRPIPLRDLLADELVGVLGRRGLVRKRLHVGLAWRTDSAVPNRDFGSRNADFPEFIRVALGELEPPNRAGRGCHWHGSSRCCGRTDGV